MKYLRHFPILWRTKTSCLRKQTTQFLFYIGHNYSLTCLLVFQLDHRSHSRHVYLPVTYTLHCACALRVHMSRSTKTKYMRMNKPKQKLSTPSTVESLKFVGTYVRELLKFYFFVGTLFCVCISLHRQYIYI